MAQISIGKIRFEAPDEYVSRMLVMTAATEGPSLGGRMAIKKEAPFSKNFVVTSEPIEKETSVDDYAAAQIANLTQGATGFKVIEQTTVEGSASEIPIIICQAPGPGGRLLNTVSGYFVIETTAYTISASHLAGLPFNTHKQEYIDIIKSLAIG